MVAVTKGFGPEAVRAALAAGLHDLGENYAQELVAKAGLAGVEARWHFLGAVQRRKIRLLAPIVDCWQGMAREVEGESLAEARPGASVLVQVDTSGLPGRGGCRPEQAAALVRSLAELGLDVRGLMTVAPPDPEDARAGFRVVRGLADQLGLPERSMGMSGDLELAVREGATMVRVGQALFGSRPSPVRSPRP